MESRLNIESVTNGLLTVQKLKQLYKPAKRQEDGEDITNVRPDKLSLLQDTLTAIKDFLPETRDSSFSEAFRQGSHYSRAYREIKHHVRDIGGNRTDMAQILKTLKLVIPILDNRQKIYMDKVVKIFDILQS